MNFLRISKSGCFYTVSNTVRSKKLLPPPYNRFISNKPSFMDAKSFYGTGLKKMKFDPEVISTKNRLEDADILALEESFSDDQDDASSIEIVEVKPAVKQSPVKARNKQFEDDFDSDFTDEDDLVEIRPNQTTKDVPTKMSALLKDFSSPLDMSSQKIKISQLSPKLNIKEIPLPKLTRVEDEEEFDDSFFNEDLDIPPKGEKNIPLIKPGGLERDSSSVMFTSSPSYHKTETVYKRVLGPSNSANTSQSVQPIKQEHASILNSLDDDAMQSASHLYPNVSPPVPLALEVGDLYPSMDSYNEKYNSPENVVKNEDHNTAPPPSASVQTKETTRHTEFQPKFEDSGVEDRSEPIFKAPLVKRESKSISNLLNRPKKRNAEILLLTQRPQLQDMQRDMQQERYASTTTRPKGESYPVKTVQTFSLSEEQQNIVDLAKRGISLFYTGSAGTGKSVLLRSMIKTMKGMHRPETVHVTASTGLAACNIGGITLHSFAGIGLGKESVMDLVKKVRKSKKSRDRWKNCNVLFIDEISMIDGKLFDKLDAIAKAVRRNEEPFGGIQVIVCGDFFQLPPVSKRDEEAAVFCFDSTAWKECIKLTITLQQVFRQKGDMEFITMLNEMRLGKLSEKSADNFRKLGRMLPKDDVEPAELYCTRYEVENANSLRLRQLETQVKTYSSFDGGYLEDPDQRERLLSNLLAPSVLHLKKGAQVMMIKNIDDTLVNGSLGKVIDFIDQETYLTYRNLQEDHFMDNAEIEKAIEKVKFDPRAESANEGPHAVLEDTVFDFLNDINSEDPEIQANVETKKELMKQLHESSKGKLLPLVKFLTPDGQSRTILVQPETWEVEDEFERPLVTRMQLPLILAWALSIHKSQGQTLPRVRVNLRKVFEKGQAYVALSRAVSREGLQVMFFDEKKVWAHPRVVEFYHQLKSAQDARKQAEGGASNASMEATQSDIEGAPYHDSDFESAHEDEHFVDAPSSPSEAKLDMKHIPYMTQDESADNIIVNRRNFRKRTNEGL